MLGSICSFSSSKGRLTAPSAPRPSLSMSAPRMPFPIPCSSPVVCAVCLLAAFRELWQEPRQCGLQRLHALKLSPCAHSQNKGQGHGDHNCVSVTFKGRCVAFYPIRVAHWPGKVLHEQKQRYKYFVKKLSFKDVVEILITVNCRLLVILPNFNHLADSNN